MQFSSALDASQLNLYDQGGTLGPADVVLTGSATGVVSGSLVMNSTGDGFTFIKTGGLLAPDTYTITLRSAANGFKGTTGLLLDGNGDGTGGDNYTSTFTVISPPTDAVTVSLPDFARGYGQPVNVPASGTGLPLTISSGQNVGSLSLTLDYDPNLLTISSFTQAAGLSATLDTSTSGVAILTVTSTGQFSSATGTFTVGTFSAQVPEEAPYASKEVLHIANLHVYDDSATPLEIPSLADDAVHVAAYFGDTNGSQTYSSADAVLLLRIASQMNTGFSAYQLADPVLIGDTTGNGAIQSSDAVGMLRVASRIPFPNVPSLPGLPLQTTLGGPDPKVFIPQDLTGEAGDTITVPVNLLVTESGGITISSADVELDYDSTKFDVSNARLGTLLSDAGFTGSFNTTIPGKIFFSGASATGTTLLSLNTAGSLYLVDFTVKADAANGTSPLNLVSAELTDNNLNDLVLTPPPTSASTDAVDGVFTISSNQAPTVATAASATPSPVTGTTTALSVLGADDGGESNLTYTWATTGTLPAAVNFSVNGTNGAKNTTATFSKAGTYNFQVAITDQGGLTVTSSVTVMVSQTLTTITVSPANLTLNENQTQQFTATGKDQFGVALTTQPTFTWGTTAGTISAGGLLTAPSTSVSNGTVTASSGTVSGTATFVVGNQAPTVATAASATPSPVTGTTTALSVLGADDGGESNLTYTWATTGTLPAAVNFSVNGTNGAKNTTATFSKAGNYAFTVTITDQGGLTVTSSVTVMVSQTLTSITVTPASVTLNENQTQQFTATGLDQFGVALSTQPSLTWAKASGVGSISAGGLYTAPAATGSASITATSGSVVGNAGVTVSNAVPRVATAASATPSPATGTTTNLSVLGADDGGERNLTYKWATTGTPPAAVNFSVNDTNGAKNTTATFSKAGTYNFQVTITDQGSLTVTSPVSVTVDQTLTTITVSPTSVMSQREPDAAVHGHRLRPVRRGVEHPAVGHVG